MMNTNKKTPKLRFKGFTDDWEQRKFGELFILKSGVAFKLSEYTKTGIPIINGESIKAGKISLEKINYLPNEYQYKYQECLLFPGDIVLGLNRPIIDGTLKISRIPADIKKSLLYQRAGKIIFKVNMDENFTYQLLSKEVLTFTKKEAVGSDQPFITTTKLNKWDLYFPVKDKERRNIGSLFNNIDNIITLHQRKLEKLKLNKSALLQKLFPQKGCTIPDVRFKGFTDAWEQRKLNDFGIATGGTSIESEFVDGGTYKVINIGSYSEESVYNDQGLRVNKTDKTKSRILNKYDLTMILNDKTASGNIIGRVLLIDQDNTYVYNQRTERIEVDTKNFLPMFLYHMLNAPEQRKYIVKASQGNTQIYVNWSTISNIDYMIPQLLLEQEKIANLFSLINKDITLHQRKLDCLISIKKGLLQQLFV